MTANAQSITYAHENGYLTSTGLDTDTQRVWLKHCRDQRVPYVELVINDQAKRGAGVRVAWSTHHCSAGISDRARMLAVSRKRKNQTARVAMPDSASGYIERLVFAEAKALAKTIAGLTRKDTKLGSPIYARGPVDAPVE